MPLLPISDRAIKLSLAKSTRAFRYRNYRLFFTGQSITLIGNWMQQLALGWLLLRLGGSATYLGLMAMFTQVPTIFLGPIAGVVADRYEKRSILRLIQVAAAAHAFILAILTLTDLINLPLLFLLALVMGCINAFEMTTRQSFVVEMVDDRRDLPNAIALNSIMFNSARAIGPAIGGQFVRFFGEGFCFLINAIGYSASNIALKAMILPKLVRVDGPKRAILREFMEGFRYIKSSPALARSLLMLTAVSLFGSQQMVLLPILAKYHLGGGSDLLGNLMMSFGVGAIITAVSIAFKSRIVGMEKLIWLGAFVTGLSQILIVQHSSILWAYCLNALTGYGVISAIVATNTVIQMLADPVMRGRAVSFYSLCLMGFAPIGGYLSGILIDFAGIPFTLELLGGLCCLSAIAYRFFAAPIIRESLKNSAR